MTTNSSIILKAIPLIYPDIKDGYFYPERKFDGSPMDNLNSLNGLRWENNQYQKPTWEQLQPYLVVAELQEVKDKKKKEIKALRDKRLLDPTPRTLSNGGLNRQFNIKSGDLLMFNTILSTLSGESTRSWEAADGIRYDLTADDYRSLVNHLVERDGLEYSQAKLKIIALEALTTLEEVEAFDINQIIVQ